MRIHNIYTDAKGVSHFRDVEYEWTESKKGNRRSDVIPVTGMQIRETQGGHEREFHTATRRQFVVNLDKGVSITASDGETRIIGAGEILLVEDTTGDGHISKAITDQLRHTLMIFCA